MFCDQCGFALRAQANYCPRCGASRVRTLPEEPLKKAPLLTTPRTPSRSGQSTMVTEALACPTCGQLRVNKVVESDQDEVSAESPRSVRSRMTHTSQLLRVTSSHRPVAGGRFVSPARLARFVVYVLIAGIAMNGVSLLLALQEAELLAGLARQWALTDEVGLANNALRELISGLQFVVFVGTVVLFLRWISRVYQNLPTLGARKLEFTSGWAIGSWFFPILNLWRPFQIVREIWWMSISPGATDATAPHSAPRTPALLTWWWITWLITAFLGQLILKLSLRGKSLSEFLWLTYITVAHDLIKILAAVLVIQIVRQISTAQDLKAQRTLD